MIEKLNSDLLKGFHYNKPLPFFYRMRSKCCHAFFMLLFLIPSFLFAQKTVTGSVSDENGQAVGNASILVKGTRNGSATDSLGRFRINVPAKGGTLVFSHLGFQPTEVAINNQTSIRVKMTSTSTQMEDVVVIGYGTQRRSDVTGAVGGLTAEKLTRNKTTDVLSALQGKVAGVQISSQSGELGSGFSIKIRGANSINGSSNPLFVIDGVPIDVNSSEVAGSSLAGSTTPNPLANINPQDIESLEVLKDASATAIYGSRGANGVVLITTKSGKAGRSSIEYDGNVRFNSLSKKLSVLNAQEFHDYRIAKTNNPADPTALQMDTTGDGIIDVDSHDWQNEVYQNSVSQNHTITISAGNKATQFSGSLNYLDDHGIIITNYNRRYGTRLRVDHNASDKLKIGFNLNVSDNVINGATNSGGAFQGTTRRILFSTPMTILSAADVVDGWPVYISPKSDIEKSYLTSNTTRLLGNATAVYKITKSLSFNLLAGGGISDSRGKEFYSSETTGGLKTNGSGSVQNIHTYNWTNTNQLTYNRQFNKGTSLNAIGVFELSSYGFETNGMSSSNFADQSTGINDISKGATILGISTNRYKNNRVSYLSRVNFNLYDKFLFTASVRADGSDKFGANNKYGYFPSGAIAWKVTNEKFMDDLKAISNLKLRVSYGVTGNEKISPYSYLSLLDNSYYVSNGTPLLGLSASNPGNADLKWEENRAFNTGFDLGLFKDRIELTADYYKKEVSNMLIKAQLPTQGGYYSQFKNLGRVDNKGVEFTVTSHTIRTKNVTWDVDFNVTYNESIIKNLGGVQMQPVTVSGDIPDLGMLLVGQPFGTGYGFIGDGVYQLEDFDNVNGVYVLHAGLPTVSGATVQPGSYKFKDINGPAGKPDGIIDTYDKQVISHSQPKFTGGFNSSLKYKGFDLTFFLQGVGGRQIINEIKLDFTGYKGNRNLGSDFYYNRWTTTNPSNVYGTWSDQNPTSRFNSTFYVEDGSYLRLQNLTVGYNFQSRMLLKGINKLRVYVTCNNLATWTKYSGYDPEVTYKNELLTGVDALAYPRSRTYMIGATATF